MDRKKEIIQYLSQESNCGELLPHLVDGFVFLEGQLEELRKLPMIKINPKNPLQQKTTPAAKLYKELLQQYTNVLKVLQSYDSNAETDEESPLRRWVREHVT